MDWTFHEFTFPAGSSWTPGLPGPPPDASVLRPPWSFGLPSASISSSSSSRGGGEEGEVRGKA
eukprot:8137-Pyramimonas_sp.AAC.1